LPHFCVGYWQDSLFCDTHKIGGAALSDLSARKRARDMDADAPDAALRGATRRYGEVTHIRFSSDELASLKAIAQREGVSVSEVVRRLVRAEAGHLPVASEALLPAVLDMTDQLRRVGLNFNQAVRAMNEGRVSYDEDLESALIAVGDLVRQFREELKAMTVGSRKVRKVKP